MLRLESHSDYHSWRTTYMGRSDHLKLQLQRGWDPLYGGEHPELNRIPIWGEHLGRVGIWRPLEPIKTKRSHHYFTSVLNPSMELGSHLLVMKPIWVDSRWGSFRLTHRGTCICQVTSHASANAAKAWSRNRGWVNCTLVNFPCMT